MDGDRQGVDSFDKRLDGLSAEECRSVSEAFLKKVDSRMEAYLSSCVRCGLCAGTCHYYLTDGEPESIPAKKLQLLSRLHSRRMTLGGRVAPWLTGARELSPEDIRSWVDGLFGRCTGCGRCSLNCSIGINLHSLFKSGRGALTESGLLPPDLGSAISNHIETGNSMAVSREEWVETVEWLQEELQMEEGCSEARLPMDVKGARILYTINPREAKFFPLSITAMGKIFHFASESWTLSSEMADLTNYGLFSGDPSLGGEIAKKLVKIMRDIEAETLVIGECGHGFVSNRWESPEWLGSAPPFKVCSVLEVMDKYVAGGRFRLDPSRNGTRVTLHDPCNLVRSGGISEEQRRILRSSVAEFVEMTPNREQNFCCGGGGGQLGMGRYAKRRLKAGKVKADQIAKTGAKVLVAPCHNCIDQLTELNKEYRLGVQVKTVAEMLAEAISASR